MVDWPQAEGTPIGLALQNAETIRLVDRQGKAVSVTSLKPGDKVLAHVEKPGRHFGMKVKETMMERSVSLTRGWVFPSRATGAS